MICPECNGKGEVKYYREVDRDAYSVTVEGYLDICHTCHGNGIKVQSNADHIRSMTDEELSEFLSRPFCNERPRELCLRFDTDCQACVADWLRQPYEEDV